MNNDNMSIIQVFTLNRELIAAIYYMVNTDNSKKVILRKSQNLNSMRTKSDE